MRHRGVRPSWTGRLCHARYCPRQKGGWAGLHAARRWRACTSDGHVRERLALREEGPISPVSRAPPAEHARDRAVLAPGARPAPRAVNWTPPMAGIGQSRWQRDRAAEFARLSDGGNGSDTGAAASPFFDKRSRRRCGMLRPERRRGADAVPFGGAHGADKRDLRSPGNGRVVRRPGRTVDLGTRASAD